MTTFPGAFRRAAGALACAALVASCATEQPPASPPVEVASATQPLADDSHLPDPIAAVYRTHAASLPTGQDLTYDLSLDWRGEPRFRGSVTQSPSMDRIALRRADGTELRYDGSAVAVVGDSTWSGARFAVFTWPYFFAAPWKLADPGTRYDPPRDYAWDGARARRGSKLSFAAGTGDAPDDYYVVVPDSLGRLAGMAYIVTYGKDAEAAAQAEPHAIVYGDYRDVDGVPVAHRWTFYNWNEADGLHGEPIGSASIADAAWEPRDESAYATGDGTAVPPPAQ